MDNFHPLLATRWEAKPLYGEPLPWYVDRAALSGNSAFLEIPEEAPGRASYDFHSLLRGNPPGARDIDYAGMADAWSIFEWRPEQSLYRVDKGLARFPKSSVLHIERGKWLAAMSVGKPKLRKQAIEEWQTGLKLKCPVDAIARRLKREIVFLKKLDSETPYPRVLPKWGAVARAVYKCLETPAGSFIDGKVLGLSRQIASLFAFHDAERWLRFLLFFWNAVDAIHLPRSFTAAVTFERVWTKLGEIAGRKPLPPPKAPARPSSFSPLDLVRESNNRLEEQKRSKLFHLLAGMPEECILSFVVLSPGQRISLSKIGVRGAIP